MRFADVTLSGPADLADFYGDVLGLPVDRGTIGIGETRLRFDAGDSGAFYHFAFLVPGDRFDPALAWATQRVGILSDEAGTRIFDSDEWDSSAIYFHDPAGNIVELIAHRALEETGHTGSFAASELVGLSELGLVGNRAALLRELEDLGLSLHRGTVAEPDRLAFVGERGRTVILAPPGRGWMPLGRPAELHPAEARIELDGGCRTVSTRRL
jgi:catechol 2,3-dioxygenase-like lactoylglutathione lyase family enzyme